jgi:hypothetical protein
MRRSWGPRTVPLRPFLEGNAFGPDDLRAMTTAFESALDKLGLKDRTDAATELVAKRIIALAKRGERDPAKLCEDALRFDDDVAEAG